MSDIFQKWYEMEGHLVEITCHFNDTRMIESIQDANASSETGEWVDGLIKPGDIIRVVDISSGCTDPGCCPATVIFTIPELPEAGLLEGEMYRPDLRLVSLAAKD